MENFIEMLYVRFLLSEGISIDTRTLQKGELFFALKGPNFNGSKYASQALDKGASYVVIDDPTFFKNGDNRFIICDDSLSALQQLAVFHRNKFKRPVLALTGSNGKTTTKELITAVLEKKYVISATKGNLNNHIGVPLSIMNIYPQVEIAVIEMGANHIGEIATLSELARPTHGLITNVGHAHTELFGGIEGVLRGKSELFDFLRKSNGNVFINQEDGRLKHMTSRFEAPVTYPQDDVVLTGTKPTLKVQIGSVEVITQLFGTFNFQNVAAAVAVGRYFEVPDELIAQALSAYKPDNMRSQIEEKGSVRLILDAYNANPDSMRGALESLAAESGKKLAILGDMFEIEDSEVQHAKMGEFVKLQGHIDAIFVGERMKYAHQVFQGSKWFADIATAAQFLRDQNLEGHTVLLKGSRSMRMEELKPAIIS